MMVEGSSMYLSELELPSGTSYVEELSKRYALVAL